MNEEDRVRLGALFEEHQSRLVCLLRRCTIDHAAADDALQEVFALVLLSWGRFDQCRSFWPWLRVIARNYLVTQMRRPEKRHKFISADPLPLEAEGPTALQEIIAAEEGALLHAGVAQLGPHLREPLLRSMEGQTGPQIAAALGIPEGTVGRRLFEARRQLHERLGGGDGTEGQP